jgi:hypothetical protein
VTLTISLLLFVSLGLIAAIHGFWASGRVWPAPSGEKLAIYVVGDPRRPHMPPPELTWLVAVALAFAACDGLALGFQLGPALDKVAAWIGAGLIAVFACRGVAGYLPMWRAAHPGPEFALLDRRFYSPYCILVAEGFFQLVSQKLWPV